MAMERAGLSFESFRTEELEAMLRAGETVLECHRVLGKTGDNIVGEILKREGTFYEWNHYPKGDVFDHESHSQYYYHAHPAEERGGEHGHFHTFLRPGGMPVGVRPALTPDQPGKPDRGNADDALSHLVAIAMDANGLPVKLFTTNRWVTGETWYKAADVRRFLERFEIDHAQPSWPVNIWITNMLILFRPQIRRLLDERDRVVATWQRRHPRGDVYEDRALEVTAEADIDIDAQIGRAHV